jgi:hypothetical protein
MDIVGLSIFFVFWFFNQNLRNESDKNFFLPNLALFNHTNHTNVTHEGVKPVHMVRLEGLVRAQAWTRPHVGLSRVSAHVTTDPSRHRRPSFFLLYFFLPLPLSPWRWLIGDFRFLSPNRSPLCHKSTPQVGVPIVLGTYLVFTVSFFCILKISLE